jgi:hypothetical protein
MMFEVTLDNLEMATCRLLGNLKTAATRGAGVTDAQMGKQNPLDIDEMGVIAEFAFCKHYNIFFNPAIHARSGTYDCILKGKRIDIKSTARPDGRLIATIKGNPDIDVFVLAIVMGNIVRFPGYIAAKILYQDNNLTDLGHGRTYAVDQGMLTPWKKGDE